jgi:hypothetical protein
MNWVRQNRFLSAFIAVMVVGIGALGFLLYSAYGRFSEVTEQYDRQTAELKRLQSLTPYPDEENLTKLEEQKTQYLKRIDQLREKLTRLEFPREELTPEQFQDSLRASVSAVEQKAKQNGVKLPDKFYLGFDQYQATPPKTEAATMLGWQLKGIELVVNLLIESKVDEIAVLTRPPLPEEAVALAQERDRAPRVPAAANPAEEAFVKAYPFTVEFVSDQPKFRRMLNDLAGQSKQFIAVRSLKISNENDKGPARSETAAAAPVAPAAPAAPGTLPAQPAESVAAAERLKFIVGTERLSVTLELEAVHFNSATVKK